MTGHIYLSIFFLLTVSMVTSSYKILVVPFVAGFNSRLLNLQKLADILAQDGHDVTVLMNTRISEHKITKYAKTVEFYVTEEASDLTDLEMSKSSIWNVFEMFQKAVEKIVVFDKALMSDKAALKVLRDAKFDLIFGDAAAMATSLLSSHLDITTILYHNFLVPYDPNIFFPIVPSITCTMPGMTCLSNDMVFKGRVANIFGFVGTNLFFGNVIKNVEQYAAERDFKLHVSLKDVSKNKVTIVNANYVLDMPLPTMPHIFPISGLYHKEPSPLNKEFSDIIQSSQPYGVILISFGTLMSEFDAEKADLFARVLGRLPQSVIWRFTGPAPRSLKSNTHLVKWFPQNDLLANQAAKLFITHCGISSTFETGLHGVPVIAAPLIGDQEDNADKLVERAKIGRRIDFYSLTEEELEETIREVLNNPKYKENAKKTSYLLNTQLVSPSKQLCHIVNFTIESEGAPHLFHPYTVDMNWFQFHSLDVISFILMIFSAAVYLWFLACRFLFRCVRKSCATKKKEKAM